MMYLYDARYNLKTETTYEKAASLLKISKKDLAVYKEFEAKVGKYYLIDDDTSIKTLKEFYLQEEFKNETWKVIEGSDENFLISNYGRFKRITKSTPEGKFIMPYFQKRKVNTNNHKQFIKVKFKGTYREYNVARLVAYHFVDIYYDSDGWTRKGKDLKYRKYTHDDVIVFHKNGLVYDNYHANLEYLDREDLAKKTTFRNTGGRTIVALDALTNEVIDYFKSTRHAAKNLPISKQSVHDSLTGVRPIVGGIYRFIYEE